MLGVADILGPGACGRGLSAMYVGRGGWGGGDADGTHQAVRGAAAEAAAAAEGDSAADSAAGDVTLLQVHMPHLH
jgi:hypothetical protein